MAYRTLGGVAEQLRPNQGMEAVNRVSVDIRSLEHHARQNRHAAAAKREGMVIGAVRGGLGKGGPVQGDGRASACGSG